MTKKDIISEIFKFCKKNNNFEFNNNLIKKIVSKNKPWTNVYDMTKLDDISKFPEILLNEDYFIAHIWLWKHKFIRGIDNAFHGFENINENEIINFKYKPSILNDYSISESSILSLCFNQRIIHDFLYNDIVSNPKIYNSERKKWVSFRYNILSENHLFEWIQIEIDLTTELDWLVTVFEWKNTKNNSSWIDKFNVYQLYNPFRYYYDLKKSDKLSIKDISACYLVRQKKENTD